MNLLSARRGVMRVMKYPPQGKRASPHPWETEKENSFWIAVMKLCMTAGMLLQNWALVMPANDHNYTWNIKQERSMTITAVVGDLYFDKC